MSKRDTVTSLCGGPFDAAAAALTPQAQEEKRVREIFEAWAKIGAKSFTGVVIRHDGAVSILSSRNDSGGAAVLLRQASDTMQQDAFEGLMRSYGIEPDDDDE